jgi:hypothetical protein
MTKKYYIMLSGILKDVGASAGPTDSPDEVLERVAIRLCDACQRDNPLFSRERFLKACGLKGKVRV